MSLNHLYLQREIARERAAARLRLTTIQSMATQALTDPGDDALIYSAQHIGGRVASLTTSVERLRLLRHLLSHCQNGVLTTEKNDVSVTDEHREAHTGDD